MRGEDSEEVWIVFGTFGFESGGRGGVGLIYCFGKSAKNDHCSWFSVEICNIRLDSLFISEYFLWPAAPPCRARLVLV